MKKIFISYRRTEAEYAAGALGRELRRRFGEEQVFRDKEDIGGGVRWKQRVLQEIDSRSALLVLINTNWADTRDAKGQRRLDDPNDPMRLEVADGIRDKATVIPILLENAEMPGDGDLPPDLKTLAEYTALKLRDGDWPHDMERICATLEEAGFTPLAPVAPPGEGKVLAQPPVASPRHWSTKTIVGAILVGVALMAPFKGDVVGFSVMAVLSGTALAMGLLGRKDASRLHAKGRGLAIATVILSLFAMFIAFVGLVQEALMSTESSINEPLHGQTPVDANSDVAPARSPDISGNWKDGTESLTILMTQKADQVHMVVTRDGLAFEGRGRLSGVQLAMDL